MGQGNVTMAEATKCLTMARKHCESYKTFQAAHLCRELQLGVPIKPSDLRQSLSSSSPLGRKRDPRDEGFVKTTTRLEVIDASASGSGKPRSY